VSLPQGDTVAAYEELRTAVLSAQIGGCSGLGVLRRAGLATWMREVVDAGPCQIASSDQSPPDPDIARPAAAPNALTGLMAGIVIALAKEIALA
jgi:hypothetical protein